MKVREKLSPLRRISELNKARYHTAEVHSCVWAHKVQASTVSDIHVSAEGWPQELTGNCNCHSSYALIHKEGDDSFDVVQSKGFHIKIAVEAKAHTGFMQNEWIHSRFAEIHDVSPELLL